MILHCLGQFPGHLKKSLFEGYSKLLDLLDIEIQGLALLMGIHYWDPSYRCFTFNDIDLTPTLEMYSHMLGMSLKRQCPIYTYSKNKIAMKHIFNLFRVNEEELAKEKLRYLIIAAIFSFVLFPTYKNSICHEALDVYLKMINEGRNLVPAILVDTFITLNQCQRSGKGRLKCCYQLLYVWLYCHIMGNGHKGFTSYRITENLLSSFLEKKASVKLNRQ
ncbi:hypothetical protein L6164_023939 [Bauhinia variegata]|uniref:Uncharacterized protein n=2 Tax=Bauhinia variegata TaxID=167791 RepID=A0ACB9LQ71_BAUVA|nr:hypothetical protein L6164_026273 [Bauhinia variegata]KAI4324397.1 hypothetical protein L6164_023939 [Bauhinia variegata]